MASIFTRALDSLLHFFKPELEKELAVLTATKDANLALVTGTGLAAAAQISALLQTTMAKNAFIGPFAGYIGSELTPILTKLVGEGTADASALYDRAIEWATAELALI